MPVTPASFHWERILSAYWKLGLWMAASVRLQASRTSSLVNPYVLNHRSMYSRSTFPGRLSPRPKARITAKASFWKPAEYSFASTAVFIPCLCQSSATVSM